MQEILTFQTIPSIERLQQLLSTLTLPLSAEIRQGVVHGPGSTFDRYSEFIDCKTVDELHDFLCDDKCGVFDNEPFTIDVMDDNQPVDI